MTDLPIQKVMKKPDVAGRMVKWAVQLSEYDIKYEPRGSIKGQIFADFVVELSSEIAQNAKNDFRWVLSVDGSSNQLGSGAGVILERPNDVLIEQSLRFAFKPSNNQAEYEALIAEILLAKEMGAKVLMAKSDSLLITGQVTGEFQAKDPQMAAYLEYVQELRRSFASFEVVQVPRKHNARADLLAKLASSGKGGRQRTVIQETLKTPRAFVEDHQVLHVCRLTERTARSHRSLMQETLRTPRVRAHPTKEVSTTQVCAIHEPDTWITPYQRYLADGVLPIDSTEARKMKKSSSKFTLIDGELYRFGFTHPLLVESANRVLLRGLNWRLEKANGSWAEEVPRIVWAYHTTKQSGTHETPFNLVYGCDAMIPIEIQESSSRFRNFVAEDSNEERRMNLDLLDEVRE
ncbi:uncharacterized protein [Phaseolus vulgaris]|uniref:uncharacterized protein n=1 Tax=Phaseolus vulgaris TaxID=3885 RepID=UPI0035CC9C65